MLTPSTRRECQRYRYDDASRAGFIELSDDSVGPDKLRRLLLRVPEVTEVVPHRAGSKAAQGNARDGHAQQHNWQVMSLQLRKAPLEVEVTTHNHIKPGALRGRQPTVTVCFRDPPRGAVAEAWRILWGAVGHLALFPDEVQSWIRDAEDKEQRASNGACPPAAPPLPPVREESWGKYRLPDGTDQHWHCKGASLGTEPQGDAAHWFLESHAQELGWSKYVHGGHVWWYHGALGIWFWEQNGET